MSENLKIVIVGGVAAGPKTAARARRLDPQADITIVERGSMLSYAGCGMPFYVAGTIREFDHLYKTSYGVPRDVEYFAREKGVKVLIGNEAVNIDREKKELLVRNLTTGEESLLPYDKLVLAAGASPFVPPIENNQLKGIYQFNHPEDARLVRENLDNVQEAVIIGAGLIGMEAADALRSKNVFVTVVELQDKVLPAMLDSDMSATLKQRLEEQMIEFRLGHKVLKFRDDGEGNVNGVITDQEELDADMVIIAVGVRPNVELAKASGLEIGAAGAIKVNEYMQTTDPDIYALGDCVENTQLITGQKVFTPMATYANRQGRVVANNIVLGNKDAFPGVLGTSICRVLNQNIARTGLGEEQAKAAGFDVTTVLSTVFDRTHYSPGSSMVLLKLIVDNKTHKVLGAQGLSAGEIAKRIDVIATAIKFGATVEQLSELDLAYAPPFGTPIDVVHHTANMVLNKWDGLSKPISAKELEAKIESDDDFLMVDVRTKQQFAPKHIDDDRVMLMTLGDIRERIQEIPKDKEVVLICAMGIRSYEAERIFEGFGFKNVKYLEGGLHGWPYDLD
ncbi:MAG: FAD-dependent oxidoreductase [Clostridia bacterium]|nr:FAD-dependent oxidoreductase [Clostridia bacterium]